MIALAQDPPVSHTIAGLALVVVLIVATRWVLNRTDRPSDRIIHDPHTAAMDVRYHTSPRSCP